jgi:flagellar biosynthesis component FlhA
MPGNIIAFEALYHCGEINEEELISEKNNLRKQADFLDAMDGALEFIAGGIKITICITALIALGGIIISTNFRGQTFQEAAITYMSFAVGHGFACLLPLVLISIAAGIASACSS